jgi:hypothetical protein
VTFINRIIKRILVAIGLGIEEEASEVLHLIALYGAETWTLRAVDQKHLESFKMWCWRRMEKISESDHM